MLRFYVQGGGKTPLLIQHVWFADVPRKRDSILPTIFFHSRYLGTRPGFERRARWTSIIDIEISDSELLNGFSRNTRYKINRAEREGEATMIEYQDPHDPVAGSSVRQSKLSYADNLVTSTAMLACGEKIVHQYIVDTDLRRVHLYSSRSRYQETADKSVRDAIGRVNRLLHFKDMLRFRDMGFKCYDFGGLAVFAPSGTKLGNINTLKQGFRGKLIEESIFISWSVIAWNRIIYGRATTV